MALRHFAMALYQFEQCTLDTQRGELTREGDVLAVRQKVCELMTYLIEHRHEVVSKQALLSALWQHGEYREASLLQTIREARKLLGDNAQAPRFIQTFPQRGYQWIAEIADTAADVDQVASRSSKHQWPNITLALLALAFIFSLLFVWLSQDQRGNIANEAALKVLVLPFDNQTGQAEFDWMRYGFGLALQKNLQAVDRVHITTPDYANDLLATNQLSLPSKETELAAIATALKYDAIVYATIESPSLLRLHLLTPNGDVTTIAVDAQQQSLQQRLIEELWLAPETFNPPFNQLADEMVWRGMEALQRRGPSMAYHLFEAALQQAPDNQRALVYKAYSEMMLGRYAMAELHFNSAQLQLGSALDGQRQLWLAELSLRKGDGASSVAIVDKLLSQAELHHRIHAEAYRFKARIAEQQMDWSQQRRLLSLADATAPQGHSLEVRAERLFYLGSPVQSGLERDPYNDLVLNQVRLQEALNFYKALQNQPKIAAVNFAMAQNYSLPLAEREWALDIAEQHWRVLMQPYELAHLLTYRGFYHLQLRQGDQAEVPLREALAIAQQIGAKQLEREVQFNLAFALFDQGRDRGEGVNEASLQYSINAFDKVLKNLSQQKLKADALTLQGWAYSELGQHSYALANHESALAIYKALNLDVSQSYAVYSAMWEHWRMGKPQAMLAYANETVRSRLQLDYLVRAHHALENYDAAAAYQAQIAQHFPLHWTEADQTLLNQLQQSPHLPLPVPASAHSIYCETDWQL